MGLLDKLAQKVGDGMEKAAAKTMTGATKEEYEKEKAEAKENLEKAATQKATTEANQIKDSYSKEELSNLEGLLNKIGAIDDNALWVAGYPNHKANQNAIIANLFSKSKLVFLTSKGDNFYLIKLSKGEIYSYKIFSKNDVSTAKIQKKLFTQSIKVVLKDQVNYSVVLFANSKKAKEMLTKLK